MLLVRGRQPLWNRRNRCDMVSALCRVPPRCSSTTILLQRSRCRVRPTGALQWHMRWYVRYSIGDGRIHARVAARRQECRRGCCAGMALPWRLLVVPIAAIAEPCSRPGRGVPRIPEPHVRGRAVGHIDQRPLWRRVTASAAHVYAGCRCSVRTTATTEASSAASRQPQYRRRSRGTARAGPGA